MMTIETYVFILMFIAICFAALLSILGWMRESERLERERFRLDNAKKCIADLRKENEKLKAERNLKVATEYNEEGKKK